MSRPSGRQLDLDILMMKIVDRTPRGKSATKDQNQSVENVNKGTATFVQGAAGRNREQSLHLPEMPASKQMSIHATQSGHIARCPYCTVEILHECQLMRSGVWAIMISGLPPAMLSTSAECSFSPPPAALYAPLCMGLRQYPQMQTPTPAAFGV